MVGFLTVSFAAWGQQAGDTLIYEIPSASIGSPNSLVFDGQGNLYVTTYPDSTSNGGTVFELTAGGGVWSLSNLYTFPSYGAGDGGFPEAAVYVDKEGNVYGTAAQDGTYYWGTVFKLAPNPGGGWTESVLHDFNPNNGDGVYPVSTPIFDKAGNLYGTTAWGGAHDWGTVFELSPNSSGDWTETILYSFAGGKEDGAHPYAGLVLDEKGNLYGTTATGGNPKCTVKTPGGCGTVFKLSDTGSGWKETVLHKFEGGNDGSYPVSSLLLHAGSLYGTTAAGGNQLCSGNIAGVGCGTVFSLSPTTSDWKETVLHRFEGGSSDGAVPFAGLTLDAHGAVYGTTFYGGNQNCSNPPYGDGCGTVFRLQSVRPSWTILVSFYGGTTDGLYPYGIVLDTDGNMYGATAGGGVYGYGTVFEVNP